MKRFIISSLVLSASVRGSAVPESSPETTEPVPAPTDIHKLYTYDAEKGTTADAGKTLKMETLKVGKFAYTEAAGVITVGPASEKAKEAPKSDAPAEEPKKDEEAPKSDAPAEEPKKDEEAPKSDAPVEEPKKDKEAPKSDAPAEKPKKDEEAPKSDAPVEEPKKDEEAPKSDAPASFFQRLLADSAGKSEPVAEGGKTTSQEQNTGEPEAPKTLEIEEKDIKDIVSPKEHKGTEKTFVVKMGDTQYFVGDKLSNAVTAVLEAETAAANAEEVAAKKKLADLEAKTGQERNEQLIAEAKQEHEKAKLKAEAAKKKEQDHKTPKGPSPDPLPQPGCWELHPAKIIAAAVATVALVSILVYFFLCTGEAADEDEEEEEEEE